ncbi:hypothetical protein D3C87_1682690 [compost metagenome]
MGPYLTTSRPPAFEAMFPPIWQLPSLARLSGNSRFDSSATFWISFKMQPASTTTESFERSIDLISFIRPSERRICDPVASGIPPPTNPVFPP